jgi:hypothetical protein
MDITERFDLTDLPAPLPSTDCMMGFPQELYSIWGVRR